MKVMKVMVKLAEELELVILLPRSKRRRTGHWLHSRTEEREAELANGNQARPPRFAGVVSTQNSPV